MRHPLFLINLGMDRQTVWTLTTGAKNYLYNNMVFNDFRLNESAESYKLAISRY